MRGIKFYYVKKSAINEAKSPSKYIFIHNLYPSYYNPLPLPYICRRYKKENLQYDKKAFLALSHIRGLSPFGWRLKPLVSSPRSSELRGLFVIAKLISFLISFLIMLLTIIINTLISVLLFVALFILVVFLVFVVLISFFRLLMFVFNIVINKA